MVAKTRIGVLVSGGGTNLQALLDAQESGILTAGEISLVATSNPQAYALERSQKAGVATYVFSTEDDLLLQLQAENIQLLVLAGFLKILSKEFIQSFGGPILNVHPALIPSFCGKGAYGLHVHEMALDYGVKVTGATVHFVNEIPDGGKIIAQKAVAVEVGDTPETLQRRVMEQAEWILLPQATQQIAEAIQKGRV